MKPQKQEKLMVSMKRLMGFYSSNLKEDLEVAKERKLLR